MEENEQSAAPAMPGVTKRRYTLAEDRIVDRWYETRHIPWMLRHPDWYAKDVIMAGRVLHRLHPSRRFDAVAQVEFEWLTLNTGEMREGICAVLPQRTVLPDWLSDLERLGALAGATEGVKLETIGALRGWRPDEMDATVPGRVKLHRTLYNELEPLLRDAMREERATRRPLAKRRKGGKVASANP